MQYLLLWFGLENVRLVSTAMGVRVRKIFAVSTEIYTNWHHNRHFLDVSFPPWVDILEKHTCSGEPKCISWAQSLQESMLSALFMCRGFWKLWGRGICGLCMHERVIGSHRASGKRHIALLDITTNISCSQFTGAPFLFSPEYKIHLLETATLKLKYTNNHNYLMT